MNEKTFLTQYDLSRRWGISPRTLERWRCLQIGPAFMKIGGCVRYHIDEVKAYEEQQARNGNHPASTSSALFLASAGKEANYA